MFFRTFFASFLKGAQRQKKMMELRLEFNIGNSKHQGSKENFITNKELCRKPTEIMRTGV
jgi:hypothetical protein